MDKSAFSCCCLCLYGVSCTNGHVSFYHCQMDVFTAWASSATDRMHILLVWHTYHSGERRIWGLYVLATRALPAGFRESRPGLLCDQSAPSILPLTVTNQATKQAHWAKIKETMPNLPGARSHGIYSCSRYCLPITITTQESLTTAEPQAD